MPIDIEKEGAATGCTLVRLRSWSHLGHEVALMRYENKDADPPCADLHLVCECDFDVKPVMRDGKRVGTEHVRDPRECPAKRAVRDAVRLEMARSCAKTARESGLKTAILDIHRRVGAGEYFGQEYASMIYAQEVAALLGVGMAPVRAALAELFAEEKLDLNGMILADFVPRFRFPREIQDLFRTMVETPLGWPNGDAGDGVIATLETAIDEGTDFAHGKDAFWPHNYPNVAASHLVGFGAGWLAMAIARAELSEKDRDDLRYTDCAGLATELERIAARFRALGKTHGFPKDPLRDGKRPAPRKKRRRAPKKRR